MSSAPLYEDILEGPINGQAEWLETKDKFKIRVAHWNQSKSKGTIILFPGRNEYIEKYGRTCKILQKMGYGSLIVDWRGQGLSDRLLKNKLIGHIDEFKNYQNDVDELIKFAHKKEFKKPWHLIGHSMGGAIGLRALLNGLPVKKVIFSSPMWDIKMHPNSIFDKLLHFYIKKSYIFYKIRKKENGFVPSTNKTPYLGTENFEKNTLTTDQNYFIYLKNQILKYPNLALAGPSIKWVHTALNECKNLQKIVPPKTPCLTFCSKNDKIVNNIAIEKIMRKWPKGKLTYINDAEHEVLMENDDLLKMIYSDIDEFLN